MSYIIRKTDGTTLGTILDGTVDTAATSLTLIGRNYSNYGQIIVDDFVALLENFAYGISPSNPIAGQLWYDTTNSTLKVFTGSAFKGLASLTTATGAPTTTVKGELWWDSLNGQLYVYDGTSPYVESNWRLVGPGYSKINGKSGAIWEQIQDITLTTHNVVTMYLDGIRTGIVFNESAASWIPNDTNIRTQFPVIHAGYNMAAFGTFNGTANNAARLGGIVAANYLRTDINNTANGTLTILNDSGVLIGADSDLRLTVSGTTVEVFNNTNNGDLNLKVTKSGSPVIPLSIDGATGKVILSQITEVTDNTPTTATTNGALVVTGGVGIGGDIRVAGTVYATSITGNAQGTATTITETLPITKGGTGATSVLAAQTNLSLVPGTHIQAYNVNLTALGALNSNGIIVRTGTGTATLRAIAAGTNMSVSNGDGVSGNPTISLATSPALTGTPTAPTPPNTDDSTRIATTAFVRAVTTPYWAGVTSLANVQATYIGYPAGIKVAFLDQRSYVIGTGNGAASVTDLYRRVVKKNSPAGSSASWSEVGG